MNETTFRVAELVIRVIAAVLAAYVILVAARGIKQKMTQSEVGKAVLAAQQILWKQSGEVRKEFAMKVARAALDDLHISISDDQLSALIEAAVLELHRVEEKKDA
nr:MAG TPA: holin [Caudoviricetes sp.]